jgi:GT2 family glycosyltransferase
MTRTISVVIPTHNRLANLERILAALLVDPAMPEIVVVDDGGSDGSFLWLEELARREPRVRPIRIPNSGEGRARQAGAEKATSEIVVFLDDDVLPHEGLISGHLAAHGDRMDLLVLGYMPIRLSERQAGAATHIYAREYENRVADYVRRPDAILEHLWAGNFSLTRAHAISLPMYCDQFSGLYFPDRELGLRCAESGLVGRFDRYLEATHMHERSTRDFFRDAVRQGAGSVAIASLHPESSSTTGRRRIVRLLPSRIRFAAAGILARPRVVRVTLASELTAAKIAAKTGSLRLEIGVLLLFRRAGWLLGSCSYARGRLGVILKGVPTGTELKLAPSSKCRAGP